MSETKTILVVDDMAVFREPIAAALRNHGFTVQTAANGREALTSIKASQPDLVLLDLAMPEMDGLVCLKLMRNEPRLRNLPVILLTAVGDRQMVVQAAKMGVRDYMLKSSFSLSQLMARVSSYVTPADTTEATNKPRQQAGDEGQATQQNSPSALTADDATLTAVEALKTVKPMMTRSEIDERVSACEELKALSPTVTQLMKMTNNPNTSVDQIIKVIKQDHAIALKIMKLANSAIYACDEPAETMQKAVMRIGLEQIRQVAMNISVVERFNIKALPGRLDGRLFWEHSIATGLIAARLRRAQGGNDGDCDSAFTMGLLHDVGRMVFAEQMREEYAKVITKADELALPLEQVESRMLLVNHADLMDKLLRAWKFPKDLIDPIALHHLGMANVRSMSPHTVAETGTLALANRMVHAMMLGSSGNSCLYATEDFIQGLKIKPDLIRDIERSIPDETADIKFSLLGSGSDEPWPDRVVTVRETLTAPLHPIYVSDETTIDGYRMFFSRLVETPEVEPNLVVVHIRHVRERSSLSDKVRDAESEAGVEQLPMLLLSPNGNLALEEGVMKDRAAQMLSSPITVARLIDKVNAMIAGDVEQKTAA